MKVLIVGGGIGGLALATFLDRQGHECVTVEKRDISQRTGYAIGVWHNGLRVLRQLGFETALRNIGKVSSYHETADVHGRALARTDFEELNRKFGDAVRFVHRADLIELLRQGLTNVPLKQGITLRRLVNRTESVEAELSDGKTDTFDLVVGADGVHSSVRKQLFPGVDPYRYPGAAFWGFVVDADGSFEIPRGSVELLGRGKLFGVYPYGDKQCGVFACFPSLPRVSEPGELTVERIRETFAEFGGLVPPILRRLSNAAGIYHDDFADVVLPRWHQGRVVLIGDAAHCMLPTTGQGASLALEDALVLSEELGRTTVRGVEEALQRFQQRREKRVETVRRSAHLLVRALLNTWGPVCWLRDRYVTWYPSAWKLREFERFLTASV